MFIEEYLKTELAEQCDVLVVGGGIAGISAALSASRQGVNVILVEREYMLGGLATAGLVTIYLPLCDGKGNQISFGIVEELARLSVKDGYEGDGTAIRVWMDNKGSKEEKIETRYSVRYNPHLFAINPEKLLLDNGVKILYGTSVCAVSKDENKINAVIVENKSGRSAISVKSVVDCSGDADVVKLSGEYYKLFSQGNILASWYYSYDEGKYDLQVLGCCDVPDDEKTEDNKVEKLSNRRFQGILGWELSEMVQLSHESFRNDVKKNKEKIITITK